MPELAETTQLLMNYGFTADDALDKMQMLGDISQGSAEKMNRIATAYGQMSSAKQSVFGRCKANDRSWIQPVAGNKRIHRRKHGKPL